jgi:hypothetical protein
MTEKMWQKTLAAKDAVFANYSVIIPRTSEFDKTAVSRTIKNTESKNKLLEVLRKYECFSVINEVEGMYL